MDSKTFLVVVFLGLLVFASCQPPPLPLESLDPDKQIGVGFGSGLALGFAAPSVTNLLTMGVLNGISALYNLVASTFFGAKLEMVYPESFLFAIPVEDSSASTAHSSTPGGEPPRRRPHTRSSALHDQKPLQGSQPKAGSSS